MASTLLYCTCCMHHYVIVFCKATIHLDFQKPLHFHTAYSTFYQTFNQPACLSAEATIPFFCNRMVMTVMKMNS